ncbi:MAG TPA: hypothetical protein VJT31_32745 [Rugosimonospora sp.]|nr:hypothetical protein [Rugosimonospora sp.]
MPMLDSSQGPPDAARPVETAAGPGGPAHDHDHDHADDDADGCGVDQRPESGPAGRAGGDGPFHANLVRWRMVF